MARTSVRTRRGCRRRGRGADHSRAIGQAALILLMVGMLLEGSGCGGESQPGAGGADGARESGHSGGRRSLPAAPVAVAPVVRGAIASYYSSTATLEPDKQADVLARVSGLVLSLEAEEGDHVAQGATLLTIEDDEYRHRLKQAEAQEDLQRSRFARLKQMFERDLTSTEEYETARSNLQAAEAAKDLAALERSHTRARAPFAGRVVARAVDPGQMVTVGTRLFTLADTQRLLARAHVPAKEFRRIHTTQPVELTLDSTHEALCGQITLISPIIDPTSGTIKVTVEINDYPASIRPGDFAMVRIVTDRHEAALLMPKIAVFSDKGQEVVYVVVDSTAQRRPVETGFRSDEQIEIIAGVVEGESVVVQGQRSLEDGQRVKISPPVGLDREPQTHGDS